MSKYKREDEKFRAQIAALADAGLTLGDKTCSIYRARPCNECSPVVTVPMPDMSQMYGSTRENLRAHGFSMKDYPKSVPTPEPVYEIAPKGRLPEFVAGMVTGALLLTGLYFVVKIALMIGGAH
jgi:hypothetical protein